VAPLAPCEGCGVQVPGGTDGCHAMFEELLARDFGDARYFRVHWLVVDTYCLQHPERYCRSAKSLAAHLAGLCCLLEHGGSRATGHEALRRWLDGTPRLERPEVPRFRGARTIAEGRGAADPVRHAEAAELWARATWEAYAPLHATARGWVASALRSRR
jgi:hypothetical protein